VKPKRKRKLPPLAATRSPPRKRPLKSKTGVLTAPERRAVSDQEPATPAVTNTVTEKILQLILQVAATIREQNRNVSDFLLYHNEEFSIR
jgi:hypothetical protein